MKLASILPISISAVPEVTAGSPAANARSSVMRSRQLPRFAPALERVDPVGLPNAVARHRSVPEPLEEVKSRDVV
jgi:hypothetical protein